MGRTFALVVATLLGGLLWLLAATAGIGQGALPVVLAALFLFLVSLAAGRGSGSPPAALCQGQALKAKALRLSPLTLAEYRKLVAELPPPSAEQQENFARFVSEAHSWYKHLPCCPPGVPCNFFIDPFAGCDRLVVGGVLRLLPREKRGFHYSELPTGEYRKRYGYLAFSCAQRTKVFLADTVAALVPADDVAVVADRTGRLRALPPEVQRTGTARVSAAVHPRSASLPWWDQVATGPTSDVNWPEESGGMETLQRIFDRCRELRAVPEADSGAPPEPMEVRGELGCASVDPTLHALLGPERERQQRAMVEAMRRMGALIQG